MTAKYGDRFRQVPQAVQRDVLDLGELDGGAEPPDDHDDELSVGPARGRPWHQSAAARLSIFAALIVGLAGGAVGWDRWQSYEATQAARSAVVVYASAMALNYPAEKEVEIGMRYRNDGDHEIVIRSVRFDTDQVSLLREASTLTIAPGTSGTHTLDLRAECPTEDRMIEPPPLELEVETVDGEVTHAIIDSNLGPDIIGWFSYACETVTYVPSFSESYGEIVGVDRSEDGTAIRATVSFGYGEDVELTITAVDAGSTAFTATYPLKDSPSDLGFVPSIVVELTVNDCALARQATDQDMAIMVRGGYEGTPAGQLLVPASPTLAAELVRLTERVCPA